MNRDADALRAKGIKAVSFEASELPCPGDEDQRCIKVLCSTCAYFSNALTLGPVRQAPARALDLLGKTWFCVDYSERVHGGPTVGASVETRKTAERGGVCATSSADRGLAP